MNLSSEHTFTYMKCIPLFKMPHGEYCLDGEGTSHPSSLPPETFFPLCHLQPPELQCSFSSLKLQLKFAYVPSVIPLVGLIETWCIFLKSFPSTKEEPKSNNYRMQTKQKWSNFQSIIWWSCRVTVISQRPPFRMALSYCDPEETSFSSASYGIAMSTFS